MAKKAFGQAAHADYALHRTKLCMFHAAGRCTRGSACTFAHQSTELRAQLDLSKTALCAFFASHGTCKNGSKCRFAHGIDELRENPKGHIQGTRNMFVQSPFKHVQAANANSETAAPKMHRGAFSTMPESQDSVLMQVQRGHAVMNFSSAKKIHAPVGAQRSTKVSFVTKSSPQVSKPQSKALPPGICPQGPGSSQTRDDSPRHEVWAAIDKCAGKGDFQYEHSWTVDVRDEDFSALIVDDVHSKPSGNSNSEWNQAKIYVKNTFIEVSQETPKMKRSASSPAAIA
eukprot:TRINITY_DN1279_c0_g3_i1.p1 TRINITY_DN1279_c0_g3~~TRINITY_DN1279_c0_g3_i1.p1  ORF type:complete len:286 (+),score=55.32 TRINITY_DN1279_c0_g3_i1:70-927(+)